MAKYTMYLNDLKDHELYKEVMAGYEIFDDSYREYLNNKIFKSLRWEEIGAETVELWCSFLDSWFSLNMTTFNWQYAAQKKLSEITDPFIIQRITDTFNKDTKSNEESSSKDTVNSTNSSTASQTTTNKGTEDSTNRSQGSQTQTTNDSSTSDTDVNNNGTSTDTNTMTGNSSSNTTNKKNTFNSDFPQGNIGTAGDGGAGMGDSGYYTSGSKEDGSGSDITQNSSTSEDTATNTFTGKTTGKTSSLGTMTSNGETNGSNKKSTDFITEMNGKTTGESDTVGNKTGKRDITGNEKNQGERKVFGDVEQIVKFRDAFNDIDKNLIRKLKKDLFMLVL